MLEIKWTTNSRKKIMRLIEVKIIIFRKLGITKIGCIIWFINKKGEEKIVLECLSLIRLNPNPGTIDL